MSQSYHTRDALGKIFADIEGQRLNQVRLVKLDKPSKRRPVPERLPILLYACLLAAVIAMVLP